MSKMTWQSIAAVLLTLAPATAHADIARPAGGAPGLGLAALVLAGIVLATFLFVRRRRTRL